MAIVIAFPSVFGQEKVDFSVSKTSEMQLLAEAMTELKAQLDFLRDHFVEIRDQTDDRSASLNVKRSKLPCVRT